MPRRKDLRIQTFIPWMTWSSVKLSNRLTVMKRSILFSRTCQLCSATSSFPNICFGNTFDTTAQQKAETLWTGVARSMKLGWLSDSLTAGDEILDWNVLECGKSTPSKYALIWAMHVLEQGNNGREVLSMSIDREAVVAFSSMQSIFHEAFSAEMIW